MTVMRYGSISIEFDDDGLTDRLDCFRPISTTLKPLSVSVMSSPRSPLEWRILVAKQMWLYSPFSSLLSVIIFDCVFKGDTLV